MNVNAIRKDIAAACAGAGYQAFAFVPEDAIVFPAAVVGVPREVNYGRTLGLAELTFAVTVAASAASMEDAQLRLDKALSTDTAESVPLALASFDSSAWAEIQVTGAEPARLVDVGNSRALATDLTVVVRCRR